MNSTEKLPLDINWLMARIRAAVAGLPQAAMFQLYEEGFTSLFEQLVACIISIRTLEETTLPTARRLFARARAPQQVLALPVAELDALIGQSTFHERKAQQIHAIARAAVEQFGGALPCDVGTLLSFHGVGVKCANLSLGIACGQPRISVDIHVHRVTNRWGYVAAATPEKTMLALEAVLPEAYRVEINRRLVPFGKYICTGSLPKCSACPVLAMCRQVGVSAHR